MNVSAAPLRGRAVSGRTDDYRVKLGREYGRYPLSLEN